MRTEVVAGAVLRATSLWRTPTPYILVLVGSIMILIALVLLVLICARNSRRPLRRRVGSDDDDDESASMSTRVLVPLDREPKVAVIIMAGERAPSFLAFVAPRGADEEADGGSASAAAAVPYV